MSEQDSAELRQRYAQWSSSDLLVVLHPEEGYRPEAVAVAREILASRGVDPTSPDLQDVYEDLDRQHVADAKWKAAPLSPWLRALCALLPGLPAFIVAGINLANGRSTRATEALQFMLIGIIGYTVLGFVCFG